MADRIVAKNEASKFKPHPTGGFVAQCVDAIDLGEKVTDYPGTPKYLSPKCALVFRTGEKNDETGDLIDVAQEFTVSMSEKSNLRPFLESWRGREYTPEEADGGVPVDKLCGKWAYIQVGNKKSQKGRAYAVIMTAVAVPKGMALPTLPPYERAKYWEDRKEEYRKAADAFRAEIGADDDRMERVTADESGGVGLPPDDELEEELPF